MEYLYLLIIGCFLLIVAVACFLQGLWWGEEKFILIYDLLSIFVVIGCLIFCYLKYQDYNENLKKEQKRTAIYLNVSTETIESVCNQSKYYAVQTNSVSSSLEYDALCSFDLDKIKEYETTYGEMLIRPKNNLNNIIEMEVK